ncbi:MAG: hypothetical protein IPH13_22810 [Planctomycetes bacterium]|nr:hypothetical protein [Planctomycetota bacterium]MCC7169381.1 hypothetical protein [Planctomycetota bacterium]
MAIHRFMLARASMLAVLLATSGYAQQEDYPKASNTDAGDSFGIATDAGTSLQAMFVDPGVTESPTWALSTLIAAACATAPTASAAPRSESHTLRGGSASAEVDVETGRLTVLDSERRVVARIPIGLALRPQWPPRTFAPAAAESILMMHAEVAAGEVAELENVVALLTEPGSEARASVAVRAGPFGPVLSWSLPLDLLEGLSPAVTISGDAAGVQFGVTPSGQPLRIGGEAADEGLVLTAPARMQFRMREVLDAAAIGDDLPSTGFRLTGRFGLDDACAGDVAVDVSLSADGRALRPPHVLRGDARAFDVDVAMQAAEDLVVSLKPHGPSTDVVVGVSSLRLDVGGGKVIDLLDVVRSARPGIDLGVDAQGGIEWDAAYSRAASALAPAAASSARVGLDANGVVTFAPQLLVRETADGRCVGLGLTLLPDATSVALDDDRVGLSLPTRSMASRGGGPTSSSLSLAVLVADDRAQLLERYRAMVVEHGTSPVVRDLGNLTLPDWWRDPCVVVDARTAERFDDVALERALADARARLGLPGATLVVDGPWCVAPGEPNANEAFARLAAITAQARLRGDHVLLAWDAFRIAPDSFGDISRVAEQGLVDTTSLSRTQDYVREVMRRTLSRQLDALAADGLVVRGLEAVRDPQQSQAVHNPAAGVGVREIRRMLEIFAVEAGRAQAGSLIVAPVGAPECIESLGMTWITRERADDAAVEFAALQLAACQPDLPFVIGPRAGALTADFETEFRFLARAVVLGTPAIDANDVRALDDAQAAALGALLRLPARRPFGVPRRHADGTLFAAFADRTFARTLADDRGVVVHPDAQTALLVVVKDGDVDVPFAVTASEPELEVSAVDTGSRLTGALRGIVYRLRIERASR